MSNFGTLYLRNLRQIPRIPTVLVFGIMMPVIQLLLFGSIFENAVNTGEDQNYISFISPAIILLTAFLGMANSSAALLSDLRSGYFDKLRTMPTTAGAIITARMLAEMTRVFLQACLILGLSVLMGTEYATGILGALFVVSTAVVFSALTTGLMSTALAIRTRSDQATQSAFPLFFIFIFLSSAYVPTEIMPNWLQAVVKVNPVDYMIQGYRSLIYEGWAEAWENLLVGTVISVIVAVLLLLVVRAAYRKSTA